jgi:hypothetical protein
MRESAGVIGEAACIATVLDYHVAPKFVSHEGCCSTRSSVLHRVLRDEVWRYQQAQLETFPAPR